MSIGLLGPAALRRPEPLSPFLCRGGLFPSFVPNVSPVFPTPPPAQSFNIVLRGSPRRRRRSGANAEAVARNVRLG